jgi:hypothetical protein
VDQVGSIYKRWWQFFYILREDVPRDREYERQLQIYETIKYIYILHSIFLSLLFAQNQQLIFCRSGCVAVQQTFLTEI